MKTLIKNIDTLVTCDDDDRVLRNTALWIEDEHILHVGELDAVPDRICDAAGMAVYPGLINTHHHLYQYFTRNLPSTQGLELFDWLTKLYEVWKGINETSVYLSSLSGMAELLRYGCTSCFDQHYVFPKGAGDLSAAQFAAADRLGIRFIASRGSMDLSKKDGGLPPDSVVQTVDEILKDSERVIDRFHDPKPYSLHQVVLAPCSPFSVSDTLLRESAALARQKGVRLHTHLCETKDEERFTLARFGLRPLAYMETLGWLDKDVFFAHGIHFNDEELDKLAAAGCGVAHCPCSNMKLSSGVARIPDMLQRGIAVGLAVDGSASNDASNLMEEIRTAYLLHRLVSGDLAPSGYTLLKMATRGGARVLGRSDIGAIKEGKAADLMAIDLRRSDLVCAERDPKELFGTVGYHRPCDLVFVNGRLVVREGRIVGLDEEKLAAESRLETERLLSL